MLDPGGAMPQCPEEGAMSSYPSGHVDEPEEDDYESEYEKERDAERNDEEDYPPENLPDRD